MKLETELAIWSKHKSVFSSIFKVTDIELRAWVGY